MPWKITAKQWDIWGQNFGAKYHVIMSQFRKGKHNYATEWPAYLWIAKRLWKNRWKLSSQIHSYSDTGLSLRGTQTHILQMQTVLSRNACAFSDLCTVVGIPRNGFWGDFVLLWLSTKIVHTLCFSKSKPSFTCEYARKWDDISMKSCSTSWLTSTILDTNQCTF